MSSQFVQLPENGSATAGVSSINTLTGAITLAAGSNISLTPSGNTITIAATGSALTFADSLVNTAGTVTLVGDTASPTASQYYGTNSGSTLGYYNLPSPGTGTVTSVSVVSANGFAGTVATATTTPAITLSTTITGILQGNGTAISAATTTGSGSVVLATSPTLVTPALGTPSALVGTNITGTATNFTATNISATTNATLTTLSSLVLPGGQVTGNITGTASNITATTNSTLTTLSSLSLPVSQVTGLSSGTVTTVSVVSANGFAGTVATATTTPAITMSTTLNTPVIAGNGTALIAATTTGTGSTVVLATSPTLVTPALGTPSALVGTNITGTASSLTAGTATNLAGGSGGTIPYQSAAGTTAMLANGAAGQILSSQGTTLAPQWINAGTPIFSGLTLDGVMYATSSSAIASTAAGTTGQILTATTGSAPTWAAPAAAAAGTLTGTTLNSTVVTSSLTTVGTIGTGLWNGSTITVPYGGTGNTSFVANQVIIAGSTTTALLQQVTGGTSGYVLTSTGATTAPIWQAAAGGNGFAYLSSNTSVYGGTNSTLSFTGADNTVAGVSAGNALAAGHDNTLYGFDAGLALTSGNFNTFIGSLAGKTSATDSDNTLVGYKAGTLINGGSDNTIMGYEAGNTLVGGGSNVIIGSYAGQTITSGSSNIIIGQDAGATLTSGMSNMVVIGNTAFSNTLSNGGNSTIYIGAGTGAAAGLSVAIGHQTNVRQQNGIAIGYEAITGGNNGSGAATGQIAIGYQAEVDKTNTTIPGIAIGSSCYVGGIGSIAIGGATQDNSANYSIVLGSVQPVSSAHTGCIIMGHATTATAIGTTTGTGQITFGTSGTHAVQAQDMFLGRGAVGDATAVTCSIQPSPVVGSNITGGALQIKAGNGTGTGGSGPIQFLTAPIGSTGSTADSYGVQMTIAATGVVTIGQVATTPIHAINGLTTSTGSTTAVFTNVPTGATTPTGYLEITINGTLSYIPYFQ